MPASGPDRLERPGAGAAVRFDALVARHASELLGLAQSMLGNWADAEDVVQETFLGAFRGLERFDGRASERTWLTSILVRQVARRRRDLARARVVRRPVDGGEAAPPKAGVGPDVAAMLASLSEEHRDVLVLREVHGLSYDEIAAALQIPRGTVESRLHRARRALRERLAGASGAEKGGTASSPEGRSHGV